MFRKLSARRALLSATTALSALLLAAPALAQSNQSSSRSNSASREVDWRYYGNNLGNDRYQNLDQIRPSNVQQLKPAWVFHTHQDGVHTSFEASPIEVNGTVFVPTGKDEVYALNAATGKSEWVYYPTLKAPIKKLPVCCGNDNRGVAYGDDMVFVGQLDGTLVALNASSGKKQWQATVAPWKQGYSITGAPQFADGEVIVGVSGGEYGIHGRVTAYDAKSGKVDWRFSTIKPDSWAGHASAHGGVPVWGNPTVDPRRGLVYITTGNASPDFDGAKRAGRDLYASSDLALDIKTGKLRWYFQEVHHDLWDYDGPSPDMLFNVTLNGHAVPALGHCGKDGQYFILDRRNGHPIAPVHEMRVPPGPSWQHAWPTQPVSAVEPLTPIGLQNPPKGYGYNYAGYFVPPGTPMRIEQPGTEAGCEWPPAAFSPRTHDIYYGARYEPTGFKGENKSNLEGKLGSDTKHPGSAFVRPLPGIKDWGYFGATDADTGRIVWKHKLKQAPLTGPAVAGDLVFYGQTDGKIDAADAKTGKVLWQFNVPKHIHGAGGADGAFSVYMAGGREYVVSVFGGSAMERHLNQKSPVGDAVVAFALPNASSKG